MIAPPFSSTSALVRMIPSMPTLLSKVVACVTTSFPTIDSPTKILRSGFVTLTIFSISLTRSVLEWSLPAVSMRTIFSPFHSIMESILSRVVPGISRTIARFVPVIALIRLDFPTLGRPTIDTCPERRGGFFSDIVLRRP